VTSRFHWSDKQYFLAFNVEHKQKCLFVE